ncbi:Antibiotic biosynthesis monooxygenase [Parafrankia sp. Ea1.12]|uniref:putative quinol monooxygenase n=1 Tax=Parafrankia sp. Ea1.12 TaxID=573499 RepID=UPI000DA5316B|nr:putative quinol monooxygenase [Parafrankia sp. Ea1.12]SQE00675.1 Antibiotic biosynthesis monooxygenase [Parafrankia sp. Ea1.12]
MFGLVVRFNLLPGAAGRFDRLVAETLPLIVSSEPGTLVYATHVVEGEPDARIFYEVYQDRAAFDEHERQEHVRRFLSAREEFLAGPPRVEFLTGVGGKGLPDGTQ